MRVYVGQTRSKTLISELEALGFGECTQPSELPPRRTPWFFDNAAFRAWKAGLPFDEAGYVKALGLMRDIKTPDFAVCPDIVAGGMDSLDFSRQWLPIVREETDCKVYLAVQDGMDPVWRLADRFDGIFVGGTVPWKVATGKGWVDFAHSLGMECHIGRVGTPSRVKWARRIGADSIDSCLPLWSKENLRRFVDALRCDMTDLFSGVEL